MGVGSWGGFIRPLPIIRHTPTRSVSNRSSTSSTNKVTNEEELIEEEMEFNANTARKIYENSRICEILEQIRNLAKLGKRAFVIKESEIDVEQIQILKKKNFTVVTEKPFYTEIKYTISW